MEISRLGFSGINRLKKHRQIFEPLKRSIRTLCDDLMEIGWLVEFTNRFQRNRIRGVQTQSVGEVDFRQADLRIDRDRIEGLLCVVELDRKMAAIVVQANALLDDGWTRCISLEAFEKR